LVGLIGTVFGIVTSFRGVDGEQSTILRNEAEWLSEAIAITAAGLFLAILASWSHRYICVRLEIFDTEMRAASLELANLLGHRDRIDR
jgi:biopolymer transport protein TolQ